jgi:hypothetical protein
MQLITESFLREPLTTADLRGTEPGGIAFAVVVKNHSFVLGFRPEIEKKADFVFRRFQIIQQLCLMICSKLFANR